MTDTWDSIHGKAVIRVFLKNGSYTDYDSSGFRVDGSGALYLETMTHKPRFSLLVSMPPIYRTDAVFAAGEWVRVARWEAAE